MHFVYILRSLKNGRYYIGSTTNLERRIREHNAGKTKGNYFCAPFELVYKESYGTSKEACRRERYIKSRKSRKYIDSLVLFGNPLG